MMPAVFQYFENAILQLRRIMRVEALFLQAENGLAIVFFGQNIHHRVPGSKAGAADPLEGVTTRFVHQKRMEACWMMSSPSITGRLEAAVIIPPRSTAVPSETAATPRDQHLQTIAK
jgi:hypothetical protein